MSLMIEDDGEALVVSLIQLSRSLKSVLSYPVLFVEDTCSAYSADYGVVREAMKAVKRIEEALYRDPPPGA